jgi:hypothetical protein
MRFNTNESVDWYIDATPEVHDEFVLQQASLRELAPDQRQTFFTGDPPGLLEVGMAGERTFAENTTDLYSVVLHEMGHALGLSSVVLSGETVPEDLQVPDVLIGEGRFGIRLSGDNDSVHLAAPMTAMSAYVPQDTRRLPSATDLLAIAAAGQWKQIDLPRQDFLAGDRWSQSENWLANRLPDVDDKVQLRHGGSVTLDVATAVHSLAVSEGTALDLRAGLEVGQLAISGGRLEVNHRLDAQSFTVDADSFLGMALSGEDHHIRVAGVVRIDGVLEIDADEGLADEAEFVLLKAGSIQGRFAGIQGVRLDAMRGVAVEVLPDRILGTVAVTGDANLDGEVNFRDFMILTNNYGSDDASWRRGNFDGDAAVNFGDFLDLTRNFGVATSAVLPEETISVPEPPGTAFALWLLLVWPLCLPMRVVNRGARRSRPKLTL